MQMHIKIRRSWFLSLMFPLVFLSCSEVMLIGAYDATVDQSIQKISKDLSSLMTQLEKNILDGKPDTSYDSFRDRYIEIESDLQALKIRTGALPKYDKVNQQVVLLNDNVLLFEKLHKTGFSAQNKLQVIKTSRELFEIAFSAMLSLQNGLKRQKIPK